MPACLVWGGGGGGTGWEVGGTDLFHFCKLSSGVLIIAQIFFISHQYDGNIWTEMFHFRRPLLRNILCKQWRERMQLWATLSHSTIMSGLIIKKNLQHRIRPYLNCQGCLQRSTWEWRQCPGKTGASACHNLPDLQYPKVLALPGEGKGKFIISTD